ncbi:hypothetical protein VNO80_03339 [Phaseolus coccineus]|uniref:Uncharacterized protein n=1 Tax=Phaseolus coccineus TaxID=3886 RepID=A0AAN9NWL0_PHACN
MELHSVNKPNNDIVNGQGNKPLEMEVLKTQKNRPGIAGCFFRSCSRKMLNLVPRTKPAISMEEDYRIFLLQSQPVGFYIRRVFGDGWDVLVSGFKDGWVYVTLFESRNEAEP